MTFNMLASLLGLTDPQANIPTQVDQLDVMGPKKERLEAFQPQDEMLLRTAPQNVNLSQDAPQTSQLVPYNYNNKDAADAVMQAVMNLGTPPGGGANPGLWGLLPEKHQRGTLRNIIGAIGDAFLVGNDMQPTYGPRMERRQMGQALAGYNPEDPNAVQAAIQRLAATGAPESLEMARQLQEHYETIQVRKQSAEQLNEYRQAQISNKHSTIFNSMAPKIQGLMYGVNDPVEYQRRYTIADNIVKRIDPEADATVAFGLIEPDQWQPGMETGMGMTQNQFVVSEDKAAGRETTERGQDMNLQGRIYSADRGFEGRVLAADKATNAVILEELIAKQDRGEKLTPAQQQTFDHLTGKKGRGRTLPPALTVAPPPAPATPNKPGAGKKIPTQAIQMLKKNPGLASAFDAKYGKGQARKILGK